MTIRSSCLALALASGLWCSSMAAGQQPVGTAFTFQGQLQSLGAPANGTYDIQFKLYTAASGGTQAGPTICQDNVVVTNGLMTVTLDFGAIYQGVARWLELSIRADSTVGNCATGTFTTLSPRQTLTPTPFALALSLPQNLFTSITGPAMTLTNFGGGDTLDCYASGSGRSGVYGVNSVYDGYGVFGRNTANNNYGALGASFYGVLGATANAPAVGGYFENDATTVGVSLSAGAMGLSATGAGVYGVAGTPSGGTASIAVAGVVGDSSTLDGVTGIAGAVNRSGVSGYALNLHGGGVYGRNIVTNNDGVIGGDAFGVLGESGVSGGRGVFGLAFATTSQNYGVYGQTLSPAGFGVLGTMPTSSGLLATLTNGSGVLGDSGPGYGVIGLSNGLAGVYGLCSGAGGSGVSGRHSPSQNYGALGISTAGVFGLATGANSFGVYGENDSPGGYGGYFVGRAYFSDNVGLGVTQPSVPLQVAGGTDLTLSGGGNIVVGTVTGNNLVFDNNEIQARSNGATASLFINASGGSVGIGTNNAQGFQLAVNGNAAKPSGGSWSTLSDARLKKNVQPLTGSLDKLLQLRGVTFEYIDPKSINELSGTRTGMIAQDVEKVFPDWVDQGPDGMRRLTFRGFEALTVEALRDIKTESDGRLAAVEAENKRLRGQLEDLQRVVSELAARANH